MGYVNRPQALNLNKHQILFRRFLCFLLVGHLVIYVRINSIYMGESNTFLNCLLSKTIYIFAQEVQLDPTLTTGSRES